MRGNEALKVGCDPSFLRVLRSIQRFNPFELSFKVANKSAELDILLLGKLDCQGILFCYICPISVEGFHDRDEFDER